MANNEYWFADSTHIGFVVLFPTYCLMLLAW